MRDPGYELPRIPIPRTPVNKGKREGPRSSSLGPIDAAGRYLLVVVAVMAAVMVAAVLILMVTLPMGRLIPLATLLAPMGTVMPAGPTSERHAPKRHTQRQHQRREQHCNTLSHCYSPPSFLSKTS
jgi:hypothetical protein